MTDRPDPDENAWRDEVRIAITPDMADAGAKAAWRAPKPPASIYEQVRRIYVAMELVRLGVR